MIAAKAMDPVVGVDIHLVQPPGPVPPVPVPHPFVGMILDPMDFAPIVGATVLINGMPRATAGTGAKAVPPHIPIGGVFVKPPGNEGDVFMGSMTVVADDDPLARLGSPVLTCHDVGMVAPPRLKKKRKPTSMELPTSVLLAVPAGMPVLVGGPPTISMTALGMKAGMAALGAGLKKLANTKLGKQLAAKFKKAKGQNTSCGMPGEPVDQVTGAVVNQFVDYAHPDAPAFVWTRHYSSARAGADGPLGRGHRHAYQRELRVFGGRAVYVAPDGRTHEFVRDLRSGRFDDADAGYRLRQPDATTYLLSHAVHGRMTFRAAGPADRAPRLARLDAGGTASEVRYDDRGRIAAVEQSAPAGRAAVYFRYDDRDRLTEVWRRAGGGAWTRVSAYAYDAGGCLARWEDGLGHVATYAYEDGRMARATDRNGFTFAWRYDAEGRCAATSGEDGAWRVSLAYEPGRTVVTEADGGVWAYEYDALGTIRRVVDPYGGVTVRETDDAGRVVAVVDPAGLVTRWLYDADGRHTGRLDPLGAALPPEDDDPNPPNPLAHRAPSTAAEFDFGLALRRHAAAPLAGLPDAVRAWVMRAAAEGAVRRAAPEQTRDATGRVVARRDAAGRREAFAYDAEGNLAAHRDADGRTRTFARTSWRAWGGETDGEGHVTRFAVTPREEVAGVVDANGNETRYAYDLKDRLTRVYRHGALREEYVYDAAGALLARRDGAGRPLVTYDLGANGMHAARRLASGEVHRYAYDERGNFTEASTGRAVVRLAFDRRRRALADLRDGRGVRHRYGATGPAESLYFDRFAVRYARADGGAVAVTDPTGGTHRVRVLAGGAVARACANGTTEVSSYDLDGRCRGRLAFARGRPARARWTRYEYSPAGELRRVTDDAGVVAEYAYDAAHRLTGERRRGGGERAVRYDPAGNVLARAGHPALRYASGNLLVADGGATFRHDERHRLTERVDPGGRRTTYAYDSLDMLTAVAVDGREVCAFEYDGLCRRTAKVTPAGRAEYFWDDDRLAAEVGPTGALRLYVYADEAARVPFMFVDYERADAPPESGRPYQLFHDQVGVPLRIEDAAGATVWRAEHVDPYGEVTLAAGSTVAYNLRFPGHYFDAETGLHYNRFRYYAPALARYLQPDPLGLAGGYNLYAYPANPLVAVDVLGLHAKADPPKGGPPGNPKNGPGAEAPPAKRPAGSGVAEGDVDSYRELNRRAKTGDGIDHDHIPAFASVRDKINKQRDDAGELPLDPDEERLLKQNLTTAAVDHDIHKQGRTYADRGGAARRAQDGANLRQAAADDLAEHKRNMVDGASGAQARQQAAREADEMAEQVHKRNEAIGLYDDPIPSTLWEDPI